MSQTYPLLGSITNPNGYDVQFLDSSGKNLLFFELEPNAIQFNLVSYSRADGENYVVITESAHPLLTGSQVIMYWPSGDPDVTGTFGVIKLSDTSFAIANSEGTLINTSTQAGTAVATYSAADGKAAWWVGVQQLKVGAPTTIYIQYNNPSVANYNGNSGEVWSNSPEPLGIYHFPRSYPVTLSPGPFIGAIDSSDFNYNLTQTTTAGMGQVDGDVAQGLSAGGSAAFVNNAWTFDSTHSSITQFNFAMQFWVNPTSAATSFPYVIEMDTPGDGGWGIDINLVASGSTLYPQFLQRQVASFDFTELSIPVGQWSLVTLYFVNETLPVVSFSVTNASGVQTQTLNLTEPFTHPINQLNVSAFNNGFFDELEFWQGPSGPPGSPVFSAYAAFTQALFNTQFDQRFISFGPQQPGTNGYLYQRKITIASGLYPSIIDDEAPINNFPVVILAALPAGPPILQVTCAPPNGQQTFPYDGFATASGGTAPYTFAVTSGALPAGFELNTNTGEISGTPTVTGTFAYTITVTDSASGTASASCSFTISAYPPQVVCAPIYTTPSFYMWEVSYIPQPEDITGRPTDWDDDGYEGNKFLQGFILDADTGGLPKTILVQGDWANLQTYSITHAGQQDLPYVFDPPQQAHRMRIVPMGTTDWRLYGIRWVWEPMPESVTYWKTQATTHDIMGYQFPKDGYIALISSADVVLNITLDNVDHTYTIPSTNGAWIKYYMIFCINQATGQTLKGKYFQYTLSSTGPFQLFQKDCEIRMHSWAGGDFMSKQPFGDVSRISGARI